MNKGLTNYDVYEPTKKEVRDYYVIACVGAFLLAYLFYQNVFFSIITCGLSVPGLRLYKKYLGEKRRSLLALQFKDFLYSLSASFAASRPMEEGLVEARDSLRLIYPEESPMICELTIMIKGIFENRISEKEMLANFAERSGVEDIRNFADVYFTCRSTGGDIEKVVCRASEIIADKIAIKKEIEALMAQKKTEGRLISLLPLVVILFLNLFSPDYLIVLYTTIQGRIVMSAGLCGMIFSYYLIDKYSRIDV